MHFVHALDADRHKAYADVPDTEKTSGVDPPTKKEVP